MNSLTCKILTPAFLFLLLLSGCQSTQADHPEVSELAVFLYYSAEDLERAAQFYESVMGFEKTDDLGWVKIYRSNAGGLVGIVDESRGSKRSSGDKPVIVSWTTDDVDAWHEHLKANKVEIVAPPKDQEFGIRSMMFTDPGGYTLEFYKWLDR